jgi:hypothetical protein
MRALKTANARALQQILGVVPVAAQTQSERP